MSIFKIFNKSKTKVGAKGFFDFSASEKKKILTKAARKANQDQYALMKKYATMYSK